MNVIILEDSAILDKMEEDYIALTSAMSKEELKEHRAQYKERGNPFQHLKTAQVDWRQEQQWSKCNTRSVVAMIDETTFGFFTFTIKAPRHCTIRHIFSLPGSTPGAATYMLKEWLPEYAKECGVDRLRFFADKKAVPYYEKLGFDWWGLSKGGLPYYYGDFDGNMINPPQNQYKSIHEWLKEPKQDTHGGMFDWD